MLVWGIALIIIGALIAVRVMPSDADRWHVAIQGDASRDFAGGALRVESAAQDALSKINDIALSTPRTQLFAGTVEEGRLTFVTRSFWIGFPDYTTVEYADDTLKLYARLRFGQRDFGVNKARIERWLSQL